MEKLVLIKNKMKSSRVPIPQVKMEPLVRYVNKNKTIQNYIFYFNEDDRLIEATYNLFLNYSCPLRHFIKIAFRKELETGGLGSILRTSNKITMIITDLFTNYGGNFDLIVDKIKSIAMEYKTGKNEKTLKTGATKIVDYLEKVFISLMSDMLIDFCSEVCLAINSIPNVPEANKELINKELIKIPEPIRGENVIGSFIFFRIITPRVFKNITPTGKEQKHILPLAKLLNKIVSGAGYSLENFIISQNKRFRRIIAQAMLQHKEDNYCCHRKLTFTQYDEMSDIFINGLTSLMKDNCVSDPKVEKFSRAHSYKNIRSESFNVNKDQCLEYLNLTTLENHPKMHKRLGKFEQSKSLEHLLNRARSLRKVTSLADDIRYFALWSFDEIINMISQREIDVKFFEKWNITGEAFIQLDENSLKAMGLNDEKEITKIINFLDDIYDKIITDPNRLMTKSLKEWSNRDFCLWLTLSKLSHLVGIFKTAQIDGHSFIQLNSDNFREMGITQPNDIIKLFKLKSTSE